MLMLLAGSFILSFKINYIDIICVNQCHNLPDVKISSRHSMATSSACMGITRTWNKRMRYLINCIS